MLDVSFGFDEPQFSDRLLEIQVGAGGQATQCLDGSPRQCKKRRLTEEEGSAGEGSKMLHVSSLLLAAQSSVFKAMFTSGMLESEAKQPVVLHVSTQSEQEAAVQLIKFFYSSTLPESVTSFEALLALLLCADKYIAAPCVAACADRLADSLTKWEATSAHRAARLLSLPATAAEVKEVKQLVEKVEVMLAEDFEQLVDTWQDLDSPLLKLQYVELESVLRSGHLRTVSEETLFSATLTWCRQYPMEQRVGYMAQLAQHIRFPQMSCEFMMDSVMQEDEMKSLESTRLVAEAGLFKACSSQRQQQLAASTNVHSRYEPRRTGYRLAVEATLDQCKALPVGQYIEGATQECWEHRFVLRLYLRKPAGKRVVAACLYNIGTKKVPVVINTEVFNAESQTWGLNLTRWSRELDSAFGGSQWLSTGGPRSW